MTAWPAHTPVLRRRDSDIVLAKFLDRLILPRLYPHSLRTMSGVLRAAAPLARRLNAVPKGPVNLATRGMACAFPT